MTQPYNMYMSDGNTVRIIAESAGHAIGTALDRYRGRTVVKCWIGIEGGLTGQYGRIDFEIPPHEAMAEKMREDVDDGTCTLFDDAKVVSESTKARARAQQDE